MEPQFIYSIVFIFPIVGFIFAIFLPKKIVITLLVISVLLLSPIIFGYSFVNQYLFETLEIIFFACLYFFITRTVKKKWEKICIAGLTPIVLLMCSYFYSLDTMFNHEYVRNFWNVDKNYRVEYIEQEGFVRGEMTYRLEKYFIIPIYSKETERVVEDTVPGCNVIFKANNMVFDKCSGKFIKIYQDKTLK